MQIAETAWIAPSAVVDGDVSVGAESTVWHLAVLRGDSAPIRVGIGTNLQDGVIVHVDAGSPCTIGDRVSVGHGAILHGCVIEDDVLVGIGATVLNDARIGRGSVVAAGAVVREGMEVPPGSLILGVPGKVAGLVAESLAVRASETSEHYVGLGRQMRAEAARLRPP